MIIWSQYINGVEIHPMNTRSGEIGEYKEVGRKRIKYPSSVVLIGDDYDFAKQVEKLKTKNTFEIKKNDVTKVRGEFVRNDMQFDDYKKVCTISTNAFDDYTLINEMEEKEVNVLECPKYTVKAQLKSYLVFYFAIRIYRNYNNITSPIFSSINIPDHFKLYYYDTYLIEAIREGSYEGFGYGEMFIYAQERIIVDKSRTVTGWELLDDADDYRTYGREYDESIYPKPANQSEDIKIAIEQIPYITDIDFNLVPRVYFEDANYKSVDCISYNTTDTTYETVANLIQIRKSFYKYGGYCGLFTSYKNAIKLETALNYIFENNFPSADKNIAARSGHLDNSGTISDINQYWATTIANAHQGATVGTIIGQLSSSALRSTFLFNSENCPGEPDFYKDYGRFRKSYSSNVPQGTYYLIHKSDFIRPNASEAATKGMLTWKQFMDFIRVLKNCDYHIDLLNKVRIEHLKYYETLPQGLKLTGTTKAYSYIKDETPARIVYEFSEGWMEDFIKKEIRHENVPVLNGEKENKLEYTLSGFSTDIDGLNQRLDSISKDGWVLVEVNDDMNVSRDKGVRSGEKIQNGNLSLVNCLRLDHRHQCYREDLYIDDVKLTAYSVKKQKIQTLLPFEEDSDINILNSIETDLGVGEFVSLKYQPVRGGTYRAEVTYE
jgi:hypothetical protein